MVDYEQFTLEDFKGLNNAMGNEVVSSNMGRDLLNVSFDKRGNLKSGLGMINMGLTTWPTGTKVLGMKFNNLYQKYYYIIQVTDYATFYEYASGAWTLRGHTTGNVATTGAGDLALVTDSDAPTTAAFQTDVKVGDYFKYDEDGDANWTRISAIPSDTTLTLATDYPAGAKAAKLYTIRKHLDIVNYQVMENPTLEDYSYWTSSDQNTSYIYKWDETNGIINVSVPANQPTNPKTCASFKNRLWCVKGTTAWNIATNTDAIWKFNETGNTDLPQDSIGANHATDVTDTVADASGLLNYCRGSLPTQYGDASDGAITITAGSVTIEDIYEDENVAGVTTALGVGKGLNNGAGTYDPENGDVPNCTTFTIDAGTTLTHGTAYDAGASNKNGIIWIACTGTFTNNGTIDLDDLGAGGGANSTTAANVGSTGYGSGGGIGGHGGFDDGGVAGTGGVSYGTTAIPTTTWLDLYGSGGGGGGDSSTAPPGAGNGGGGGGGGHANAGSSGTNGGSGSSAQEGSDGGNGGGAIRIYAPTFITSSGTITVDGGQATAGGNGGTGGSGSGGTVYIETLDGTLGTNLITASAGATKASGGNGGDGGAGSVGRIHIEGSYTGSTNDPAIA